MAPFAVEKGTFAFCVQLFDMVKKLLSMKQSGVSEKKRKMTTTAVITQELNDIAEPCPSVTVSRSVRRVFSLRPPTYRPSAHNTHT